MEEIPEISLEDKKRAQEELEGVTWEYRIFSTKKPKENKKFGLKKVFLKDGKVIDFKEQFVLRPVFDSTKQLKDGLDTMLRDLSDTREGSMVLEQKSLSKLLKEKGEVDIVQDIYYG